jgi:hypothetical protein
MSWGNPVSGEPITIPVVRTMPRTSETGWGKTLDKQFVPFDEKGDQVSYSYTEYAEWAAWKNGETWAHNQWDVTYWPNEVFADTLVFRSYGRGRSAVTFTFTRKSTGTKVVMFVSDMTDAIPDMVHGHIMGSFTFVKRGGNYGCKLVKGQDG